MSTTAPTSPTLSKVSIDLQAITHNAKTLRAMTGSAELMAVVKADGYGHGAVASAKAAVRGGATWLGVALIDEALQIRSQGVTTAMLAWLFSPKTVLDPAVEHDIDLSASAPWAVEHIAQAARRTGKTARVHLKIDTGLARGGAPPAQWESLLSAAREATREGTITIGGMWSHFAVADEPQHPTVQHQPHVLREAVQMATDMGLDPGLVHIANSAATLTDPKAHFDMVRVGLALYGLSPVPHIGSAEHFDLRPAMTLKSTLVSVKEVPAGQGVSYGHVYTTTQPTTLGLVPLGYADGIPRHASMRGPVQIGNQRTLVAGRVCMDQFVVDLGPGSAAQPGDEVILFGPGQPDQPAPPSAQEWAEAADTISYEIVTRLGPRVPHEFVDHQPPLANEEPAQQAAER